MDNHKDNGILLMKSDLVKYYQEVINVGGEQTKKLFNSIYEEISEEFGFDVAIKMYQIYKGMQITFPTRLFNPEYVKKQIPIEYDGTNIKQLAKKYGYSEKTIRRMIKDLWKDGCGKTIIYFDLKRIHKIFVISRSDN